MRDADRPIGRLRKPPSRSARRQANPGRPLAGPEAADARREYVRGPARGIVLGLAPALLLWAGLIAVFARLFK